MKSCLKKLLLPLSFASVLTMPGVALATNGYFLPGYGAKAVGMGGVGVAFAQDSISAATNPAGLSQVGSRMDIGAGLFNPVRRSAVRNTGGFCGAISCNQSGQMEGDSWSTNKLFILPNMGMSFEYSDNITLGFAMVGNGGMNTTYNSNFYASDGPNVSSPLGGSATNKLGVDMAQLLIPISLAYKVNDTQTVAGSLVLARQRFAARGLESFIAFGVTNDPDKLTNKGADYSNGYGMRLGWLGKFDRLSLGATWASKTYMDEFKKYSGLFAEQGDFDIPENYAVGVAFNVTPKLTAALDVMKIKYSKVRSVGNRGPDTQGVQALGDIDPLVFYTGKDDGMGFGWTNQTVVKVGFNYEYSDTLTLRTGYNFGKSPIPDDQLAFNLLAPATVEKHYAVGFTYKPSDETEVTMSFMHAKRAKQSRCGLALIDCAEIEMYQNVLDVGFGLKF